MRTIRAYIEPTDSVGQSIDLPAAVFQHLVKVLRLGNGALLEVFNGHGRRFKAELTEVGKKRASLNVLEELESTPESPLHTHMGLVMSKGDRFDYALQKATEMGVTSITPLTSERCDLKLNAERSEKKMAHWHGVIASACEQCYRDTLPILYPIRSLADWVTTQNSDVQLVFHTAAHQPQWPMDTPQAVSFLVGPEGGLTEGEVALSHTNEFNSWQLGPRILRTETAPIAILSLLQMKWGDF
jgi:16S rRNA (uracil1498-N3)-methyltransferase